MTYWEWRLRVWPLVLSNESTVACLDGKDATGGSQVRLVGDVLSSTEISANSNTLKDVCHGEEALDIGVTEVVGACGHRSCTGGYGCQ